MFQRARSQYDPNIQKLSNTEKKRKNFKCMNRRFMLKLIAQVKWQKKLDERQFNVNVTNIIIN